MGNVGRWVTGSVAAVSIIGFGAWNAFAEENLQVADGLSVSIEYTLALSDNSVVDSNVGQEPFAYIQGAHQIIPGLEKALIGMKAGQSKKVDVPAAEAYGEYDPKLRVNIEKSRVPDDIEVGSELMSPDGRRVKVVEISGESVVLDLNHPMAGKNLTFQVKIIRVEPQRESTP